MIFNLTEYEKALEELRDLETRLAHLPTKEAKKRGNPRRSAFALSAKSLTNPFKTFQTLKRFLKPFLAYGFVSEPWRG
jgi:hypothetical protein